MSSMFTLNDKGAIALTPLGAAAAQKAEGKRGGALVVLSTRSVGPRGKVPTGGLSWDELKGMVDAAIEEGVTLGPDALFEQLLDLAVLAAYTGDVRGGKGERVLLGRMMCLLYARFPRMALRLLALVPEFASWRALVQIDMVADELDGQHGMRLEGLRTAITAIFAQQLEIDAAAVTGSATPRVSLAAKWAPTEGAARDKKTKLFARIAQLLFGAQRPLWSAYQEALPSLLEDITARSNDAAEALSNDVASGSVPSSNDVAVAASAPPESSNDVAAAASAAPESSSGAGKDSSDEGKDSSSGVGKATAPTSPIPASKAHVAIK
jgi:hypothetical protein